MSKREEYIEYLYHTHSHGTLFWLEVIALLSSLVALSIAVSSKNDTIVRLSNYILIIFFFFFVAYLTYKILYKYNNIDNLLKEILSKELSEQEIRKRMEELKLLPPNEDEVKKVKATPDGRAIHKKKNTIPAHKIKVPKK